MIEETLAYKMQPAGHDAPEKKRKYIAPDRKLSKIFEKYINSVNLGPLNVAYHCAKESTNDLKQEIAKSQFTLDELHSLYYKYADHPNITMAAPFFSAAYNIMPTRKITFDANIGEPLKRIGCCLNSDKILAVLSNTSHYLGEEAHGTILNYGQSTGIVGTENKGLIVNYGYVECLGGNAELGTAINLGMRGLLLLHNSKGYIVDYIQTGHRSADDDKVWHVKNEIIRSVLRNRAFPEYIGGIHEIRKDFVEGMKKKAPNEIWNYLQKLKGLLDKKNCNKTMETIEKMGKDPAKKIKTTLDNIFKRNGGDVET